MPYKLMKKGDQVCVMKKTGEMVKGGCHSSRAEALGHMRALYAAENKELTEEDLIVEVEPKEINVELKVTDEDGVLKEATEKSYYPVSYPPPGIVTFAAYDEYLVAQHMNEQIMEDAALFKELALNIAYDSTIEDKASAMSALANEFTERIKNPDVEEEKGLDEKAVLNRGKGIGFVDKLIAGVGSFIKSKLSEESHENSGDFIVWKEGGRDRFLVRYSNNFRDNDNPPEIISEASHQHFVRAVESKEAEMPELWLWHVPDWRVGRCDWLAYDDSGFALASGLIDVGKEALIEQIAAKEDIACSHGMPSSSIKRDTVDSTIIIEHITKEISLLPYHAAANKLTGFVLLGSEDKEDDQMAIPTDKRNWLIEEWGVGEDVLDKIEAMNKDDAAKAIDEGIERKEEASNVTEQAAPEDTPGDEGHTEQAAPQDAGAEAEPKTVEPVPYPTREEIAEAFTNIFTPFAERLVQMEETVAEMSKQLKETTKGQDEQVEERLKAIPPASLAALFAQKFTAVGAAETKIDGRESLAKSGPKETPAADDRQISPIPFINAMLTPVAEEE